MDVGLWDLERTLSKGGKGTKGDGAGKRKKGELEEGQVWGAKNVGFTLIIRLSHRPLLPGIDLLFFLP